MFSVGALGHHRDCVGSGCVVVLEAACGTLAECTAILEVSLGERRSTAQQHTGLHQPSHARDRLKVRRVSRFGGSLSGLPLGLVGCLLLTPGIAARAWPRRDLPPWTGEPV